MSQRDTQKKPTMFMEMFRIFDLFYQSQTGV